MSAITINISLNQIATFFTLMGAGVIAASSFLLEEYSNRTGYDKGKKVVGSTSVAIIGGAAQLLSSVVLYFKDNQKKNWTYVSIVLVIVYIICFAIPLADDVHANSYYAVLLANWILLFITIGLLSKDSSPAAILFSVLGISVMVVSSLVLKEYSNSSGQTGKKVIGCSSAALVGGLLQTITSIILFFKGDIQLIWMYANAFVCILLIVCFAIPLAVPVDGVRSMDNFYAVTAIDFIVLFVVVGMFFKNKYKK